MDPYKVLGVDKDASEQDVRRAYRKAAKRAHPDAGGSAEEFQSVALAHRILSDKERRAKFDETGDADGASAPNQKRADALGFVAQILDQVINTPAAEYIDVPKVMRSKFDEMIRQTRANIKNAEDEIARLVKLRKRSKAKAGAVDHIGNMLDQKADHLRSSIANAEERIGVYEMSLEMIAGQEFEVNKEPRPAADPFESSLMGVLRQRAGRGVFGTFPT